MDAFQYMYQEYENYFIRKDRPLNDGMEDNLYVN